MRKSSDLLRFAFFSSSVSLTRGVRERRRGENGIDSSYNA